MTLVKSQSIISSEVDADSPPDWVDAIFTLWIIAIHIYYSFQFTNYSLKHIYRELVEIQRTQQQQREQAVEKKNSNVNINIGPPDQLVRKYRSGSRIHSNIGSGATTPAPIAIPGSNDQIVSGITVTNFSIGTGQQGILIHGDPDADADADGNDIENVNTIDLISQKISSEAAASIGLIDQESELRHMNNSSTAAKNKDRDLQIVYQASMVSNDGDNININTGTPIVGDENISKERMRLYQGSSVASNASIDIEQSETERKEQLLMELEFAKDFVDDSITVEYITLGRPLKGILNRNCCFLFPWSNVLFTWSRTSAIRLFLRLFILLMCCLAFVLWVELFVSSMLEVMFCSKYIYHICFVLSCFVLFLSVLLHLRLLV